MRGKLALVLMGRAMLSKSLIPVSFDGWCCVPSLLFDLRPNYGGGDEDNGTSFKRFVAGTAELSALNLAAGHCRPTPLLETPGHIGKSGSVSCGVTAPFSWVLVHTRFCLSPPSVCFPVLCKFWQLYVGVNGDLLQEGLCHTQVCCTQSTWPCSRPLLTHASAGDFWTLTSKSGPVSCGVTALFSWVLVCTRFFVPSKSLFPQSCMSSGSSMVGLMATFSKRAYAIPKSAAPRAPDPMAVHC